MDVGARFWIAILVLGSALLSGCGTPVPPPTPPQPAAAPPPEPKKIPTEVTIREGELSVSDDAGRPVWKTTGKTIQTDDEKGTATFTDATCQMFDGGAMTLGFRADVIKVDYNAKPQKIYLKGNVVAQSPTSGWKFRTPLATAVYGNKKVEKITAEQGVQLQKSNLKMQGATLTADVQLKRMMLDQALSVIELPEKRSR